MKQLFQSKLVRGGAAIMTALLVWEGAGQLTVYADRLAGGLATVCGGSTNPVNGKPLKVGHKFTPAQCAEIDRTNVLKYSAAVDACIHTEMNQNQFDAFTLFAINVGINGFCSQSRAAKLFNAGQKDEACRALATGPNGRPAWSEAGGKYVQGLQNRRRFERDWCLRPVPPVAPNPEEPRKPSPPVVAPQWARRIEEFVSW